MKRQALFGIITLLAAPLMAQDSSQTDVSTAAQALANQPNYSWKQTVVVPPDSQFQPAPIDGQTEKDGYTFVSTSFGDNDVKWVIKGDKFAVYTADNGWQAPSEMDDQGPGRFMGAMIRNFKTPAQQATNLLAGVKSLTKNGDVYSGDLTDDGAKSLLTFRRGGQATVSNAKGSAKFWISNGVLSKYEFKVTGTVSFNGNDRDIDRDTTVEISNVGTTKVALPDDAKKKLSS
ncbi:MAG TPA: hypothetical protein VMH30_06525 [Verrucomicrobiae bacterium]|nr:hypothetical protein [Verrucomicrobiae bacterium]